MYSRKSLLALTLISVWLCTPIHAEESESLQLDSTQEVPFKAFTGKVTRNKVRMRLQPGTESAIIKMMQRGDLMVVVGETDEFYAVEPPADTKAYIFRTFVLDNVVEGNRVNVRLEPRLEAPVISQMNHGDRVEGKISSLNNKWLEIPAPPSVKFFISKDYVENIGDPSLKRTMEQRQAEAIALMEKAYEESNKEMTKPFKEIELSNAVSDYTTVAQHYPDVPEQAKKAKEMLAHIQEAYLKMKVEYLENNNSISQIWQEKNQQLAEKVKIQQEKLAELEEKVRQGMSQENVPPQNTSENKPRDFSLALTLREENRFEAWQEAETNLYKEWERENAGKTMADWYQEQINNAEKREGLIEVYPRAVKNKPGDYLLINPDTNQTIAYLYSTRIDLQNRIGRDTTLFVVERPNNRFAFPAFYVLSVE